MAYKLSKCIKTIRTNLLPHPGTSDELTEDELMIQVRTWKHCPVTGPNFETACNREVADLKVKEPCFIKLS